MGQRGPQPKPNVLKLIQGNPGKRPLDLGGEVMPEIAVPDCPRHLNKEARKEWKRITVELQSLGLISRLDRAALALYCQAWGQMVLLEESLNADVSLNLEKGEEIGAAVTNAMSFTTNKGYQGQSVKVQLINNLREQVNRYLAAFGLSPSSRGRVKASSNTGQQPLPGMDEPQGWGKFQT